MTERRGVTARPVVVAQVAVAILIAIKIYLAIFMPPIGDEAYYWMWGQKLGWSYFDHPPLHPWLMRLMSIIFGWNLFSIRALTWFTLGGTLWIFWLWAKRLKPEDPSAWFWPTAAIYLATPLFFLMSGISFHDHLLIFLCALTAHLFLVFAEKFEAGEPNLRWLYAGAVALGLAVLTKYNGVFIAVGLIVFFIAHRPLRRMWRSVHLYFVALIMAGFQARSVANALYGITGLLDGPGWEIPIAMTLVAGTALLGWLGDQITLRGVGNGFWLLLITPTLVNLPNIAEGSYVLLQRGTMSPFAFFAAAVFLAAAVAIVAMVCKSCGAEAEHRMSGADFASVWPPLLATTIAGFVAAYSLQAGGPAHLVLIVTLIATFNWLQSLGAPESSWPVWTTILVQIFVCTSGELLTHQLSLPIAINGAWVIIVVTTAMNCLRSMDLLPRSNALRPGH